MDISKVGVLGAGTMGGGIAQSAAQSGFEVHIVDRTDEAVSRALDSIGQSWDRSAAKGRMSEAEAEAAKARIGGSADPDDLAGCDLVIEAIFEDLDEKTRQFRRLSDVVREDAILATNTSSFRVTDLAKAVSAPERFLGMHYFVPANINRLVEIVRGPQTSDVVVEAAHAFAKATDKAALDCRDGFGFAVNRFFVPCVNEAVRLADEGHAPERIERVSREVFGARVGVLSVMNMSKARIALHACRTLGQLGPFYKPAAGLERMGAADEAWSLGEEPAADAAADAPIAARLRGAVFLPVLQALDEAIAAPAGFDLGAFHGLRWEKTPCAEMDRLGREEVAAIAAAVAKPYGTALPRSLGRAGSLLEG